jgi:hypothetical protein
MSNPSWFKATLSGIIGAAIGVVFVAVANMASPVANLAQLLVVVCVPSFLSAVVGHIIGARRRGAP